jgi:phage head maturation protease
MEQMQLRSIPGSSIQIDGSATDVDPKSHTAQFKFPTDPEVVDTFKSSWRSGAFQDGFDQRLPTMCLFHNLNDPIGRAISAQSLPKHTEVIARFSDLDAVSSAKRAHSQLMSGDLTDVSFGFVNGQSVPHPSAEWRKRGAIEYRSATMIEISPVVRGSIPGAVVTNVREQEGNGLVAPTVSEILELRREKLITDETAQVMLRDAGMDVPVGGVSTDPTQRTFPESAAVDAANAATSAAQQAFACAADAARLANSGFNPEVHVQLINAADWHDKATAALYQMALDSNNQVLANLAMEHSFRGQEARKAAGVMAQAGTDPGVAQRLATGVADQAKATAALTAQVSGGYPSNPGGTTLNPLPPVANNMVTPRSAFPSIFDAPITVNTRDDAGPTMGAGSDVVDTGSEEDSGNVGSLAGMAEESRDEAVKARSVGDHKSAQMHARHARMHAQFARKSANLEDPDDANNVERAERAAASAEDVEYQRAAAGPVWNPEEGPVTADLVMEAVGRVDTRMAEALVASNVAVAPAGVEILFRGSDGKIIGHEDEEDDVDPDLEGSTAVAEETAMLAASVDAALDSANQWFAGEDIDVESLPDGVQQGLALVGAAGEASRALLEALEIREPEEDLELRGDAADWSTKPWSDFSESDYTPEQWKAACLVKGDDDEKGSSKLPVKEPDGTYNVHGIAAASARLNQLKDVSDEDKKSAAKTLMSLHGKMKKSTPPNVLKVLGAGKREDEEAVRSEAEIALETLNRRLARRQEAAADTTAS